MTFFAFLLVIAVCVLVHEFGHFASARLIGVRVHEFAFGMGPALLSVKRGVTRWSVRVFPVGGFVRLAGMGEEQEGEDCAEEESSCEESCPEDCCKESCCPDSAPESSCSEPAPQHEFSELYLLRVR